MHVLVGAAAAAVYGIPALAELPPIPVGLLTSAAVHQGRHHGPGSLVGWVRRLVGHLAQWVVGWLLYVCSTALPIWQI